MYVESAHERLFHATKEFRKDLALKPVSPPNHACACCGRSWERVENPSQAYPYQYSSGMATEWVCTVCYTPRIGAKAALGRERYAGGNIENPVYGKLGMLPGSGGVATADNELHLALPQGFIDKYAAGELGSMGRLHRCNGLTLLLTLLSNQNLGDLSDGIVVIESFGRKADALMSNLKLTRNLSEVWFCSEKGARCVDLKAVMETAHWLYREGFGDKAIKPAFWRPIQLASKGQRDEKVLEKWSAMVGDPATLVSLLPVDPHTRLELPGLLRYVMPYVEEGRL